MCTLAGGTWSGDACTLRTNPDPNSDCFTESTGSDRDGYDRKTCDWKECRDKVCGANSGCCEDGWTSGCVDDAHELCY